MQIGANGQISLGNDLAGRTVVIDSNESGIWVIKTAQTSPATELLLRGPLKAADLDALERHPNGLKNEPKLLS